MAVILARRFAVGPIREIAELGAGAAAIGAGGHPRQIIHFWRHGGGRGQLLLAGKEVCAAGGVATETPTRRRERAVPLAPHMHAVFESEPLIVARRRQHTARADTSTTG